MICMRAKRVVGQRSSTSAARAISRSRWLRIAVLVFGILGSSFGQALFDQAHISSAIKPQSSTSPTLRADANLVLVPVTVLDSKDRVIIGLQAEDFSIS